MSNLLRSVFFVAVAAFAATPALAGPGSTVDQRFIGEFQGQRNPNGKCQFLTWSTTRGADGKFALTFFNDKDRTRFVNKETGTWWVEGSKLYLLTDGLDKPEAYTFKFRNKDAIELTVVKRDPSADCKEDYRFTDYRLR